MRDGRTWAILLIALLPAAAYSAGRTVSEYRYEPASGYRYTNQPWDRMPGSLVTPHVAWANPSVYGPLKVLVISPCWSARETVELAQRLSLDATPLMVSSYTDWYQKGETYNNASAEQLRAATETRLSPNARYQAILIGSLSWTGIPEEVRKRILAQVNAGAGLVYVNPTDADDELQAAFAAAADSPATKLAASLPLEALALDRDVEMPFGAKSPDFKPRHVGPLEIKAGKLGAGRVIFLDYHDQRNAGYPWRSVTGLTQSLTPDVEYDPLFYDYYHAILAKTVLWAARQDVAVSIRADKSTASLPRSALPAKPLSFTLTTTNTEPRRYTLHYEVRDRRGQVVASGDRPITLSAQPVAFAPEVPRLARGLYMVDLWAMRDEKVVNWASAAFTVEDTAYLGAITPDKQAFARTEGISGKLTWKAALPAGKQAVVELWDAWGRLEQRLLVAAGATRFAFQPLAHPLSRAYRLLWQAREGAAVVDETDCWVGLPDNTVDDFEYMMWSDALRTRYSLAKMWRFQQLGVTGYYDTTATWSPEPVYRQAADLIAQHNLLATPYCFGVWGFCISEKADWPRFGFGRFSDTLADYTQRYYPPKVEAYRRYGTLAYCICEENNIARGENQWTNPEAVRDFRLWLAQRYGEVAKLNAIWGTGFKSFDEIGVISLAEAKQTGQYTHWYDQEQHMVDRFTTVHEVTARRIQELDPGSRVSVDCIGGMDFDWPRMMKIIRAGNTYPGEDLRRGQGDLVGDWVGAYERQMEEGKIRIKAWRMLFEGGRQLAWWPSDAQTGLGGSAALTPDLSEPLACMKQASEEVAEVRRGAGKLLLSSTLRLDPILILWSDKSYYAGTLNPPDVSWTASREGWTDLVRRLGFSPRTVDSEYIEKSLQYGDQSRVLILPCAQALSQVEAQKIRAFLEAGGVVVSDVVPGVFDEYLRPYAKQTAPTGEVKETTCEKCKGTGKVDLGTTVVACPVCGGTGKVVTGARLTLTSVLADCFDFTQKSVKQVGKGYALYLKGYPANKDDWPGLRRSLIEYGKVPNRAEITDATGALRWDAHTTVFEDGPAMFLGILPDVTIPDPPGSETHLKLDGKYHVYDVRRHQYLGYGDAFDLGIIPAQAVLLALLPQRIESLSVSVDKAACAPGEAVTLKGQLAPASLKDSQFVVHVEVYKEGKPLDWLTRNVSFKQAFAYPLPMALNAERGTYQVKATEVVTGVTEEARFIVK
jgi:beta-galactosidase